MRVILLVIGVCLSMSLSAQHRGCYIDPDITWDELQEAVEKHGQHSQSIQSRGESYFQVVIHIISRGSDQFISEAQVLHQLDVLNRDFNAQNENLSKVSQSFSELVGTSGFTFCLAKIDPEGQPTTGITYTQTSTPNFGLLTGDQGRRLLHYDLFGGKDAWDPERYINIWVVEFGDFLGTASFPGLAPFPEEIGVIINIQNFGSIGMAGQTYLFNRGHTLTHEMGHFFGLQHIWGDGLDEDCKDSDGIDDTPNAAGPYYGCPSGDVSSCGSMDMVQNFMDFTDDRCLALFTKGQINFMQSVIPIHYPDLLIDGQCIGEEIAILDWLPEVKWAYDAGSGKIIIYHPESVLTRPRHVTVYGMDGKQIISQPWGDDLSCLLDMQHVATGVYIIQLLMGDMVHIQKVFKQ